MPENVPPPDATRDQTDEELTRLLQKIYDERGFDFREYKKDSVRRRIQKRLDTNHLGTYPEYLEFLDSHQDEYAKLFDTVLINVTEFFRDQDAWKIIETEVLPEIISRKKSGDSIRIWSAGCASGEEPYSIAILLAETLGDAIANFDIRIYATDIDDNALTEARRGVYSEEKLRNVRPDRLEKYFAKDGHVYKIDRHIRQMVAFGRQDLTADAPISHLDLLICRNVLIYFNAKLQHKLLYRFDFAMNRGGYIFFGKSESTALGSKFFEVVSQKWRIFQKTANITELRPAERRLALIEESTIGQAVTESRKEITKLDFYNQAIINNISLALIVLDRNNLVTTWNRQAEEMWLIKADYALGRNFYEIGMGDRIPGINDALRETMKEKRKVLLEDKEITVPRGDKKYLDLTVVPLIDQNRELQGAILLMDDVTEDKMLRDELGRSNEDLKELNAKLETTNEEMESTNEELETTAEELQSTTEELETSNEELQSTNEELETSNEELRSTNAELEATNTELRERTAELNIINTYNGAIINNIVESLIVLDSNSQVTTWNPAAAQMWGASGKDTIGRDFFTLDLPGGIQSKELKSMIKAAHEKKAPAKGKAMKYRTPEGEEHTVIVSVLPLISGKDYLGTMLLCRDVTAEIKRYGRKQAKPDRT